MKHINKYFSIKLSISLIALIIAGNLSAQVGGISGSKISSYTVDVVDHHKVEFEPAFYHFKSSKRWDENSTLKNFASNADSVKWVTGLNFRITYGLLDKLEIGADFSSDLLLGRIGMR